MGPSDDRTYSDTGRCLPESRRTLELQQEQLKAGRRDVQMFPIGTRELPLPDRLSRFQNERGVFHFHADRISADEIARLSAQGRENIFLMLGPYSKPEIIDRFQKGERLFYVTEHTPDGVEFRSAAGAESTIDEQFDYFELSKEPGNTVVKVELDWNAVMSMMFDRLKG
jgi:hypothetical protein